MGDPVKPAAPLLLALLAGCAWLDSSPAPTPTPPAMGADTVVLDAPTLSLTIGSRRSIAVLVQQNGEQRIWRGRDGVVVATDGARVTATAGLPVWLTATRFDGADPLDDPLELLGHSATVRRQVDLSGPHRDPARMRFGVALACTLRGRMENSLLLVEEDCNGAGTRIHNRFWADPQNGAIFRSEQWIGGPAMLAMDVLKAPTE